MHLIPAKKCPNCGENITAKECSVVIYKGYGICKICKKKFQIRRINMIINTVVISLVIGISARVMMNSSIFECISYSVVFTLVFQRFLDFFYDLEKVVE